MIKFSSTQDWDFDIEAVQIVTDSKQLTKRASARELLKFARTPNQTDLHIIALGAYEGSGFNRNCDMFKEADCRKNAHYFRDADRAVNRNHKNKPTDPKYGNIKAAAYNENMKRIELIIGLDNDKCADILDEQEKKGSTNWSMASSQAYDICTFCGHKAKGDNDRCEHIPDQLGEINKQGEMCGMENPEPKWFEISKVGRQADRIGVSLKLASDSSRLKPLTTKDYLALYPGFVPPIEKEAELILSKKASDKRELLHKIAAMEKHLETIAKNGPKSNKDSYLSTQAHKINKSPKIEDKDIDSLRKHKPDKAMKAMADKGVMLNPDEFSKYLFGDRIKPEGVEGMKSHLHDVYSKAEENPTDAAKIVNSEKFEPSASDMLPPELQQLINKLFEGHSLMGSPASQRVLRITIQMGGPSSLKSTPIDEAKTKEAFDKELANVYASYKLAALNYMQEQGTLDDEVLWNALIQNRG